MKPSAALGRAFTRRGAVTRAAAFTALHALLAAPLGGCSAAALAGISAAGSVAGAIHEFAQVGGDIVAATAVACQDLAAAHARAPGNAALPWYDTLCSNVSPSNPNLDTGSPAWVAAGLAKVQPEPTVPYRPIQKPNRPNP